MTRLVSVSQQFNVTANSIEVPGGIDLPAGRLKAVTLNGPAPFRGEGWTYIRSVDGNRVECAGGPLRTGSGRQETVSWMGDQPTTLGDRVEIRVFNPRAVIATVRLTARIEVPDDAAF